MKIGVLLPSSRMFPRVDQDFLTGLRAALRTVSLEHELIVEPIGSAAAPPVVVEKVQRLLMQHAPDVVTGIIGSAMLRHVHGCFADAETALVVNNLGAEPLLDGGTPFSHVFHNSFNLWQSTYALGWWAARHLGRTAGLAIGFHDAGYGMVAAFCGGFERGGGAIVATEVTHRERSNEDPTAAVQRIASREPAFVMALYAGQSGVSFARSFGALELGARLPLLASALMVHDGWRAQMGGSVNGARTAFCWSRDPDAANDVRFRDACAAVGGAEPDLFAVLGYETGLALHQALERGAAPVRRHTIADGLRGVVVASPRGAVTIDAATGESLSTDFLLEVRPDAAGTRLAALAPLELPPAFAADYLEYKHQELRSGWTNPYMIT